MTDSHDRLARGVRPDHVNEGSSGFIKGRGLKKEASDSEDVSELSAVRIGEQEASERPQSSMGT